jgi:uncharacterized phage protein (TIGR02218 family)
MKVVPIELVTHKAQSSTTLCLLRKIGPLPDNSYRYQCSLDRDVVYDDGDGEQTYKARIGYDPSALVSTSDLGVDNAEGQMLAPLVTHELEGITIAQVEAGALDKVPFVVYEVNYNDLTPGRHEIRNGGTFGEVTRKYNDAVLIPEERSLSQQLKQNIGEVTSLTCRAKFGSQPIGTGGGAIEERFPCGFDTSGLWVDVVATAVDSDEPELVFSDGSLAQANDFFQFGVVTCTAGANAGQTREIESFASGQFVLRFAFTQPVALADAFQARPGCSKRRDGNNGCKHWWDIQWGLHYRGEPYMPIADAAKLTVPGAAIASNTSGTGEVVT